VEKGKIEKADNKRTIYGKSVCSVRLNAPTSILPVKPCENIIVLKTNMPKYF